MPTSRFSLRGQRILLALALATAACAAPAGAGPRWPDLYINGGGTFAVSGDPNKGGFESSIAGLWPVDDRLSFGLTVYADDMGSKLAQFTETGPPLTLLGTYESDHRFVYGAGWRLDYEP